MAFDPAGRLYFVELSGERLRTTDPDGLVRTLAGSGRKGQGGDGGPAVKAEFNGMHSLAVARTATSTWPTPGTTASARSTPAPA